MYNWLRIFDKEMENSIKFMIKNEIKINYQVGLALRPSTRPSLKWVREKKFALVFLAKSCNSKHFTFVSWKKVKKLTLIYPYIPIYTHIYPNIPVYTQIYLIYPYIPNNAIIYPDIPWYTLIYSNIPNIHIYTHTCPNIPLYTQIYLRYPFIPLYT